MAARKEKKLVKMIVREKVGNRIWYKGQKEMGVNERMWDVTARRK